MTIDPSLDLIRRNGLGQDAAMWQRLSALEARLTNIETSRTTIQQLSGTPTTSPRDGTPAADTTGTGKFWLRVNGTWRFVNLS